MTTDDMLDNVDAEPGGPGETARKTTWIGTHGVNIRFTLPFLRSRHYFKFMAGRERRGEARLKEERIRHPLATRANILALAVAGTITGLALLGLLQLLSVMVLQDAGVVSFPR